MATNKADRKTGAKQVVPVVRMASGQYVKAYTLTDPEVKKDVEAYVRSITASPEAALRFLQKAGMRTASGRLTKPFRDLASVK